MPVPAFKARFPSVRDTLLSAEAAMLGDKDESQKLQTRTLDECTAPHCKHVFVTGAFCAADACTPVRSVGGQNSTHGKSQADNHESVWPIGKRVRKLWGEGKY